MRIGKIALMSGVAAIAMMTAAGAQTARTADIKDADKPLVLAQNSQPASSSNLSNAELAEKVGLSSSPCWRRVKVLEEAGVIKGYAALLDAKTVGLSVNVFVSVSLSTQNEKSLKDFERAAAARPEVMECYLMTGDSDYLLRVVVPDLEAYERFVMDFTKIPGIAQIRSSFALRPVKQGTALPLG